MAKPMLMMTIVVRTTAKMVVVRKVMVMIDDDDDDDDDDDGDDDHEFTLTFLCYSGWKCWHTVTEYCSAFSWCIVYVHFHVNPLRSSNANMRQ